MAEMVPESIVSLEGATAGEKRVFRILRETLKPHSDYIVWYEPKSIRKRTDFLIWGNDLGLLVVEVKDWSIGTIRRANHNHWTLVHGEEEVTYESPVEQARRCFIQFRELLQRNPVMHHKEGLHKGRMKFPIGYCVVFTQITRKQAEEHQLTQALPVGHCFFREDLIRDFEQEEVRASFIASLKSAFDARFTITPLRAEELQTLRCLIFPEVCIRSVQSHTATRLRNPAQTEEMLALDLEQERTARALPEGHRILKGVAGSGKTLVLACRARHLHRFRPDWRILIVCFNIALCQHIVQLLQEDRDNIDVFYYHHLVKHLTGASLAKLKQESQEEWGRRIGTILRNEIASGRLKTRYDAILIDEGQDFEVEWLQSLTELLNEETDSLLFCLDPAQNIFGRKVSFKSVGIKVQGKRPIMLRRSYRNTTEILSLARSFSGVKEASGDGEERGSEIEDTLFPVDVDRHGPPPRILTGLSLEQQIHFVLDEIKGFIHSGECGWSDIGVLYTTKSDSFAQRFASDARAEFGRERVYWITASQGAKAGFDPASQSIRLSTIASAKGMEFRVVFLLGLERLPTPGRPEENERKLAYVGLTRAQDTLYVMGENSTGYLAELSALAAAQLS